VASHENELALEDGDLLTADSHEIARIWVTNGAGSNVWINPTALSEPIEFGYLMADALRHAARAYSMAWDVQEVDALQLMCDGLLAELREQVRDIEMIKFGKGLN
jgi:hypothetical protein